MKKNRILIIILVFLMLFSFTSMAFSAGLFGKIVDKIVKPIKETVSRVKERIDVSSDSNGNIRVSIKPKTTTTTVARTVDTMSPSEREKFLNQIPQKNVNGQALNKDLFIKTGIVSYGIVPNNDTKNGQNRYYGYDANGNLYTNADFPHDANSGRLGYEKNWLSLDQIANSKNARKLVGYNGSSVENYNQLLKDANKLLENNPDWKNSGLSADYIAKNFVYQQGSSEYGGGSFVGVHQGSNGKLWYQTFTVPQDPYKVTETITSTTPGVSFTIKLPKEEPSKPRTSDNPSKPYNPSEPNNPEEDREEPYNPPTTPSKPTLPKTGNITINYKCKNHGVFDYDVVNLQVLEGKSYNVKIPAKNFHPVHKLIDAPEKNVTVSYNNPTASVTFLYEDYYAKPKMDGIVRPEKLKSGYGFEVEANYALDTNFNPSEIGGNIEATVYFLNQTYKLEKISGNNIAASFRLPFNPDSMIQARKIYTPVELKDGIYKATITINGATYPNGNPISIQETIDVEIKGHMYEDDYTKPKK